MRTFFRTALVGGLLASVAATLGAQPRTLTILHTNDMHATFIPRDAVWVKQSPRPLIGGFRELEFAVDSIRDSRTDVVLLDAGDVMTGNPITEREYQGAQGGALFSMMNRIGYDAWCIGNHDLDISQENLAGLVSLAKFPTLCANLVRDTGQLPPGHRPYVIIERNGIHIGIIGLISQELYGLVLQANLTGLKVLSPVETLQRYIDELDPQTDLLIALTHQGFEDDSLLALGVHGLDLIVGGHSHTRLRSPKVVNSIPIAQAGSYTEYLGVIDLTVDRDRITAWKGQILPLWADRPRPMTPLGAFADSLQRDLDREYSEVIGMLKGEWVRKQGESTIGSYVTEAQRLAVHADVGFMNVHGIRRDLSAGPITKRALFEALPFRNVLTTFQLSGAQLRSVLKHSARSNASLLMTGITAEWSTSADGSIVVRNVRVNGSPLDESRLYSCTASDYLVGEADRYLGLELQNVIYLRKTLFDTVEQAIRHDGEIVPKIIPSLTRAR